MADLVRVRLGDVEKNVGAEFAQALDLEVLDEPTTNPDGTRRDETRVDGRPRKPKTTVDKSAAAKNNKAAASPASTAEEATR